jgi:predicted transcriptional regulator
MENEFIIKKNKNEPVTFSIRIDKDIVDRLDELANKSNRPRNQLINKALRFALENLKFVDE